MRVRSELWVLIFAILAIQIPNIGSACQFDDVLSGQWLAENDSVTGNQDAQRAIVALDTIWTDSAGYTTADDRIVLPVCVYRDGAAGRVGNAIGLAPVANTN